MNYDYEPIIPPFEKDSSLFTKKETKKYFAWFTATSPKRVKYLQQIVSDDLQIDASLIDLSPDSLVYVWRWFLHNARTEPAPLSDIQRIEKELSDYPRPFVQRFIDLGRERYTFATLCMLVDAAMYIGETFIDNNPTLYWSYYEKPKTDFFVNKPVIAGFVDKNYEPPFKMYFEPVNMVSVQAAHIWDDTQDEQDLLSLYRLWTSYVE